MKKTLAQYVLTAEEIKYHYSSGQYGIAPMLVEQIVADARRTNEQALTTDTPTLPELEEVEEKYSLRGPLNIKEYHYNQNEMVDTINNLVAHVKALEGGSKE